MLPILSDWFLFIVAIVLSGFLFFDEEPMLDPTDWNIVHIVLFTVCTLSVVWDNVIRARYGQFVYKDQVLLFSTFSFWFALENYSRFIVMGFCFHCLTPLELELVELVEVYQSLLIWYTADILPLLLFLVFIFFSAITLNSFLNWPSSRYVLTCTFVITTILVVSLLVMLWDFVLSSMTGCTFRNNSRSYYNAGRSSIGYDMTLFGEDSYDWHRSNPDSFIFRFEDSYFFFLQLFNIMALYSCAMVWLFFFSDMVVSGATGTSSSFASTHTFAGVCIRWLDHALWCFYYSYGAILFVGMRVTLRIAADFNI
jgi:hypothetical protein